MSEEKTEKPKEYQYEATVDCSCFGRSYKKGAKIILDVPNPSRLLKPLNEHAKSVHPKAEAAK